MKTPLFLAFYLLGHTSALLAWNKEGHMLTAAIAYLTLKKENPAALRKAISLLEKQTAFQQPIVGYLSAGKPGQTWAEFVAPLSDSSDRYLLQIISPLDNLAL